MNDAAVCSAAYKAIKSDHVTSISQSEVLMMSLHQPSKTGFNQFGSKTGLNQFGCDVIVEHIASGYDVTHSIDNVRRHMFDYDVTSKLDKTGLL